jgi:phosphoribosylglycinamide formyltransferase 1
MEIMILNKKFYVIVDDIFNNSYLLQKIFENFSENLNFLGVIFRSNNQSLLNDKIQFHKKYKGQKELDNSIIKQLQQLYGSLSNTEKTIIERYGIPELSPNILDKSIYIGDNLNDKKLELWVEDESKTHSNLEIYISIDQILKPFWLKYATIINTHPAVLPYARGMCALEQTVSKGNVEIVKKTAGATVHFVDEGIDTGNIIAARRIINPFSSNSLADLKGRCYILSFDLLVQIIVDRFSCCDSELAGIKSDISMKGPNYFNKDYTSEFEKLASKVFEKMKNSQEFEKG